MTHEEKLEYDILKIANEDGRFALQIGHLFDTPGAQAAFERLLFRRWIALMDISPITSFPDRVFRVFLASDEAMAWFRRQN